MTSVRLSFASPRRPLLVLAGAVIVASLVACAGPTRPQRAQPFDLGLRHPPRVEASAAGMGPLVLAEVEAGGALDTSAMLYRLDYVGGQQLKPYAQSRWSMPPAQLVRLRLRQILGEQRPVLGSTEAAAALRQQGTSLHVLRVELEEFSQVFDAPSSSRGVVHVRVSAFESTPAGERLLQQRVFVASPAAPTPDAAGGAQALAAAVDDVSVQINQWAAQWP